MEHRKILLVDDNSGIQLILQVLLEKQGYKVYHAKNGDEAIGFLSAHPSVDLVILDLRMPILNGVEFLEARTHNASLSNTPVLILTGDPNGRTVAEQYGVSGFLPKGGDTSLLLSEVRRILAA